MRFSSTHRAGSARFRTRVAAAALAAVTALVLTSCASPGASEANDSSAPTELTNVSFALDWTPNTNHIGVYVAQELGYFEEAGLDVEILPYASTPATQLVSAGNADFGVGGQASVQMGRTSGLDIVSVYRTTQTDTGELVLLGDRDDIQTPADLDGLTFGGFGQPLYTALAASTIQGAGGQGEFEEVMLDTGAYEALSQGRIDFTLSVATWEGVQAEIDGHPYKSFRYQDYGVPDYQSGGIVSSQAFLDENPEVASAFVQAVARGYAYAVQNPAEAADLLIAANPDTLGTAEELVHRSTELLATEGYFVADELPIGAADPAAWDAFGAFLFAQGFLMDAEGKPLTEEPDWSAYYTDDFLE